MGAVSSAPSPGKLQGDLLMRGGEEAAPEDTSDGQEEVSPPACLEQKAEFSLVQSVPQLVRAASRVTGVGSQAAWVLSRYLANLQHNPSCPIKTTILHIHRMFTKKGEWVVVFVSSRWERYT